MQITRGVVNTPSAISGTAAGKQWDTEKRRWIHYSLPAEIAEVEAAEQALKETGPNPSPHPSPDHRPSRSPAPYPHQA